MSITMIVELSCDYTDCDVAYAPDVTEVTSISASRVGSLLAGWMRDGHRDYCPEHAQDTRTEVIRKLARQRLTDDDIADRLGVSRRTVFNTRKANGIPAGIGRTGRPLGAATGTGRRG